MISRKSSNIREPEMWKTNNSTQHQLTLVSQPQEIDTIKPHNPALRSRSKNQSGESQTLGWVSIVSQFNFKRQWMILRLQAWINYRKKVVICIQMYRKEPQLSSRCLNLRKTRWSQTNLTTDQTRLKLTRQSSSLKIYQLTTIKREGDPAENQTEVACLQSYYF